MVCWQRLRLRWMDEGAVEVTGCRLSRVSTVQLNRAVLAFPTGISGSASWKRGAQKKINP